MKKLLVFTLFIWCASILKAQDGRNYYLWNTTSLSADLNSKSSLALSVKTHYLASEHFRDMSFVDLSMLRTITDWFNVGLAFRVAQMPKVIGEDVYEYRPQLVTQFYNDKHKVSCKTTNRLEHQSYNIGKSNFRYYHNLFIDFPAFAAKLPKLYVGEELFTKLNQVGTHLGRIYGGLHVWDKTHLGIDMYYVWQKSKSADQWVGADIFGMNLKFKI